MSSSDRTQQVFLSALVVNLHGPPPGFQIDLVFALWKKSGNLCFEYLAQKADTACYL
jgi:hypothetical protein